MALTVNKILGAYRDELDNWNYFSDGQRCYLEDNHIVCCLRNYNWYITKEPVVDSLTAIKALFEIDWIASVDDSGEDHTIDYSKYWKEY